MSVFNKSGKVHAPDAKYTGDEPDWYGWERWPIEKFYKVQQRALGFYNYYLDAASLKPIVLQWMKNQNYSKEDISSIRESPPWYLPTTVGKLIRMMDRGMPSLHPNAHEYFKTLPLREDDTTPIPRDTVELVKSEIKYALSTITADSSASAAKVDVKPKVISPHDRIRERVEKEIMPHIDQLLDAWSDTSKNPVSLNLASLLRDQKIPAAGCAQIKAWIGDHLEQYRAAYQKSDEQCVEGYSYLSKPHLRKIVSILEAMENDCNSHAKMKNSMRKPRAKKPKAADRQVARLKYQVNSAEYSLESVSPARVPYSQRVYIFNTKTRQLGVYCAAGNGGLEVKGTSLKGYDPSASYHATLRKPKDVLTAILAATPKKIDKVIETLKLNPKKANGRFNEHTVILKVLEHRP